MVRGEGGGMMGDVGGGRGGAGGGVGDAIGSRCCGGGGSVGGDAIGGRCCGGGGSVGVVESVGGRGGVGRGGTERASVLSEEGCWTLVLSEEWMLSTGGEEGAGVRRVGGG
jgi:hypothetical protein